MPRAELPVLGWKEQASLPDLGVPQLRVKLDTGARSSALHVERLEVVGEHPGADGSPLPVLSFDVLSGPRHAPQRVPVQVPAIGFKHVRDTGARSERRPVIRTRILCGPLDTVADVTITDRTGMIFRMLLGRLTLQGRCLVDPMHGYLVSPTPRRGDPA